MALDTWTTYAPGVTYSTSKSLVNLFNDDAVKVAKLWRLWLLNNQTSAITGVVLLLLFRRLITGPPTGGSALTPIPHDSAGTALDAQITVGTGQTVTAGATFRRVMVSSDEPTASGASWDELECVVPFSVLWDSGYGDSNVSPMTFRENEGFDMQQSTTSVVGTCDINFEFTQE